MVVTFAVTLTILLSRQPARLAPTAPETLAPAPLRSRANPQPAPERPAEPARTAAAVDGSAAPAWNGGYPTEPADIEVPAVLTMHPDPAGPHETVSLLNRSSETLAVTVTASDPASGAQSSVQVSLEPHRRRNLGEAGLIVDAGMQVALHSPPYKDFVVEAR